MFDGLVWQSFFLNGQNCEIVGGIEEVLRQHTTIALENSLWTALNTASAEKLFGIERFLQILSVVQIFVSRSKDLEEAPSQF